MKIYCISLGPGEIDGMTYKARKAIASCDVIVGYTLYLELIASLIEGKEIVSTPMRGEIARCQAARDIALQGKRVAVISSGDIGVYGMAGLMHEVCEHNPELEIEVIAGVTAACSGAALLGAPLMHDFAVISLSDLLTPWDLIEQRIHHAAQADFVICLYNPGSHKRADYLQKACAILLESRCDCTPCGIAASIGRQDEACTVLSLGALARHSTNMFETVFIGNSKTKIINGKMVTPRGYNAI